MAVNIAVEPASTLPLVALRLIVGDALAILQLKVTSPVPPSAQL